MDDHLRTLFNDYRTFAFIDSNIILEGKSVEKLPWAELEAVGPILIMVLPQVQREIDSKKRDGRLQTYARAFNRLVAPSATSGAPTCLQNENPKLDIGLARCAPIPWAIYDDLDPSEGDCKVIAELLNVLDVPVGNRVFVSADIHPISMASRHGIKTFHAKDSWIRQAEPGPAEKENQRLRSRISELESKEPQIELDFYVKESDSTATKIYRVSELTNEDRTLFISSLIERNPKERQKYNTTFYSLNDHTYDDRYEEYSSEKVPKFANDLGNVLELLYGQIPFKLTVNNIGKVQAESLIIEVSISSGWFNDMLIFESTNGPTTPKIRNNLVPILPSNFDFTRHAKNQVGLHDVILKPDLSKTKKFEIQCQDFRHGRAWDLEGVIWLDPRINSDVAVSMRATSANMRGEVTKTTPVRRTIQSVTAGSLIDLQTGEMHMKIPMAYVIDEAIRSKNFDNIEISKEFD